MRRFRGAVCVAFLSLLLGELGCDKMPWSSDEKSAGSKKDDQGDGEVPAVCKRYEKKWKPCVYDPTPEESKKQTKQFWEQAMVTWKINAQTKEGRRALADSCQQMLDALPKDCDK